MTRRNLSGVLLGAIVLSLAVVQSAQAGKYHAYSCRTPAGAAAPVEGWSSSKTGTFTTTENSCATGGALLAALPGANRKTHSEIATWELTVPSAETLTEATLWRAGDKLGEFNFFGWYSFYFAGPENIDSEQETFGRCSLECTGVGNESAPLSKENELVVPTARLGSHLYMDTICGGDAETECSAEKVDSKGYNSAIYLYAANLVLEQSEGPSVKEVSGPLATEKYIHGTSDLIFNATDPGSGIYQAVFTVDGHVVQETVLNENGGHCKNVGETTDGLPAFLYLQPCAKSVSADVGLETTKLSNGRHHIVVTVTDAAGNVAYALDREVEVFNPGGLTGYFWRVGGSELEAGASREFMMQDEYPEEPLKLAGKFDNKEVSFLSTHLKVTHAVITGGKPGKAKETLTLEDVSVSSPGRCEVDGGEIVTALAGELVQATNEGGTEAYLDALILGPASGSVFAEITLEGAKCVFAGDTVVVEGSALAELFPEEELKAKSLGLYTNSAKKKWYRNSKGELGATELKVGSKAWIFTGTVAMTLETKEAFGAY